MRFIHQNQEIVGEVIDKRKRCLARLAVRQQARVIFDAGTVTHFLHHFNIIAGTLLETLCLQQTILALQQLQLLIQLRFNAFDGQVQLVLRRNIMGRRVDCYMLALSDNFTGHQVHLGQTVNFVAKKLDADNTFAVRRREHLDSVAMHAERATGEVNIIARILDIHQLLQNIIAALLLTQTQGHNEVAVVLRVT